MQCCLAFSANACDTDGAHQQTAGNETVNDNGESETDSVESGEGLFDLTQGENGKPPVITLSSGYTMPVLGLGTYSLHGDECINAILSAIKLGYRKFDTATFYGNEEEVGEAIRRSGVPREEFFICTKLSKAMLSNETLKEIAEAHGKSPAQVILRWDLQHGVAVIPGSSNPDHQKENISVFDFELTPEEMARIDALDRNEKHDWY